METNTKVIVEVASLILIMLFVSLVIQGVMDDPISSCEDTFIRLGGKRKTFGIEVYD